MKIIQIRQQLVLNWGLQPRLSPSGKMSHSKDEASKFLTYLRVSRWVDQMTHRVGDLFKYEELMKDRLREVKIKTYWPFGRFQLRNPQIKIHKISICHNLAFLRKYIKSAKPHYLASLEHYRHVPTWIINQWGHECHVLSTHRHIKGQSGISFVLERRQYLKNWMCFESLEARQNAHREKNSTLPHVFSKHLTLANVCSPGL